MRKAWLLLMLVAPPAAAVSVPAELPPAVCSAIEPCRMVGMGRLRWWGFHVYDAALWAREGRWNPDAPYVLDIVYARNITGVQLASTSIDEIRRMGVRDEALLSRWDGLLRGVFPDVQPGSRLTGLYRPQRGLQFYSGTRLLGAIDDPELARRFFEIWLDPRTQKPDLRSALLGGHGGTR
ncbi:MAG: chalcone isomerase family protein [Betaproteobacteria bacterium]|jgi:hypothetical protein|nr:chalcone isomerase family protein [Betaproteobacteria bacterium]